jgi:hypothetical protein
MPNSIDCLFNSATRRIWPSFSIMATSSWCWHHPDPRRPDGLSMAVRMPAPTRWPWCLLGELAETSNLVLELGEPVGCLDRGPLMTPLN